MIYLDLLLLLYNIPGTLPSYRACIVAAVRLFSTISQKIMISKWDFEISFEH